MTERVLRVVAGQRLSAERDNRLADQVDANADALIGDAGAVPALDADADLFHITDVSGTTLGAIAGTAAPLGGEETITIRLPAELEETARGGVTVTHVDVNNANATDGTTNETWVMTKSYAVGDVIRAQLWDADGVYVDANMAGRMWAALPVIGGGGGGSG